MVPPEAPAAADALAAGLALALAAGLALAAALLAGLALAAVEPGLAAAELGLAAADAAEETAALLGDAGAALPPQPTRMSARGTAQPNSRLMLETPFASCSVDYAHNSS